MKRTALLYAVLAAAGVVLYLTARSCAVGWRGHAALGGEMFLLAIPTFSTFKIVSIALKQFNYRKDDPNV